jgi:hypothetical protein
MRVQGLEKIRFVEKRIDFVEERWLVGEKKYFAKERYFVEEKYSYKL